jgi:hypothetical protein
MSAGALFPLRRTCAIAATASLLAAPSLLLAQTIDVQPLSEIVKLPDVNMAEALQRIPAISLETDSGGGRFINIRGLDSDLNGTTYAGVRLPASNPSSPFGGGRAVAFDTFPTGIVGGVEVSKTLRPPIQTPKRWNPLMPSMAATSITVTPTSTRHRPSATHTRMFFRRCRPVQHSR